MLGSNLPVSSQQRRQDGGSKGSSRATRSSTLRRARRDAPRSSSLATTGERRTGRSPTARSAVSVDSVPRSSGMWMLVSKKATIEVPRFRRPGGGAQDAVGLQPLLLLSQQGVDEIGLRLRL